MSEQQFKCFADESVFALHSLLLTPIDTVPLHFRHDAGFRLPTDRCACQGYEVLLKDGGIVGVKLAFSAKEPLDNVWFIPRTATSKTHLAKGDMDMHAIHLGNFRPSEKNDGLFETMFKWKFPIVADRSLHDIKTSARASRSPQAHASLTSQGLDKLASNSLTPPSGLSASSQHSKSSSSSSHLPLTVGSSELSPRRTSVTEHSFTFNSLADVKPSLSTSNDLSPNFNEQHVPLVRMHDTAQDQQCHLSNAVMGLVFEAPGSDIADDDSEEPTSPNSDSAPPKPRVSVFGAVKHRLSTIGHHLGHSSKSSRASTASSTSSRKLSNMESNDVMPSPLPDSSSSELGDEESITELEVDDGGELVAVHASSPLLLSKKNFKAYRLDGRLTVSQQFYLVEGGGRVLARLRLRFIATCAPIPPLCSYCRARCGKLRPSSNEQSRLAPKPLQTADVLFVRSHIWKQSLFYGLMKRDDLQVIPYIKLIELQERMFEHPTAPRALDTTTDNDEELDQGEHRDYPTDLPAHQRAGKFVNYADFETQVAKALKLEQADSTSFLEARDGIKLAYRLFKPSSEPIANVLFIATFGFGSAWCLDLASRLSKGSPFNVFVLYERGHGPASLDSSGDAPSKEALWRDIRSMVRHLRWNYPALPLVVGGHSNGGAKLLNYLHWKSSEPADAVFLINPFLRELMRKHKRNMTRKDHFQLTLNAMTGGRLAGHWTALNLSNFIAQNDVGGLNIPAHISVNMMTAVMVNDTKAVFESISVPFALWAGSEDEIFPAQEVLACADYCPSKNKVVEQIEGGSHVGTVEMMDDHLAPWIKRILPPLRERLDAELAKQAAILAARRSHPSVSASSTGVSPSSSAGTLTAERSAAPPSEPTAVSIAPPKTVEV
ncbi:hypothetical protein CAOG_08846 [Capsaspora owczarzaki ATCC 30864]|uniref:Serine aminopeptidase S33 domain-containing protein n=1 Tax=Capsaspora owczarzaki (strain ATCC 30864) TaxID=595528 RepID=A0A0D2WSB3_CAPO3|nr:hypothetical protein CAOG_08846 [Capsaspora owczarzaki ATCC 30864]KJE94303.1 hypothetical protein CAOG_008846 [Capsaspora owczarzaki ATCC 30864]|eukprot:XP_011270500.1 hypothetical protein CAOG_08846 [Capsaspora owczarzaki ATCC 30864]